MGASWDWGGINKATCDDIVRKIRKGKGEILLYDPVKKQECWVRSSGVKAYIMGEEGQ